MAGNRNHFRGAEFISKRSRQQHHHPREEQVNYDRPPTMGHLRKGRVYQARVPFHDDPSKSKVRPVVFLRPIDRDTTEVLAVYSRINQTTRPESVRVEVNRRRCYLWLRPVRVDRIEILAETPATIDPDDFDIIHEVDLNEDSDRVAPSPDD